MTRTLSRYLSRHFLLRCLATLLALASILQILDLLEGAGNVLQRGGGLGDIAYYTVLRLPVLIERLVPLAVLIGSLTTLASLARHNEIVAMRSAGLTPYQLLAALLPAALGVALFHLVLSDQVTPRAERAFLDWWSSTEPSGGKAKEPRPLWVRVGGTILSAREVRDEGRHLIAVDIFVRDAMGRLTDRITAEEAVNEAGSWTLMRGREVRLRAGGVATQPFDRRPWEARLHPANILEVQSPTENIPMLRLRSILRGTWSGTQSPAYYLTRLHETYASPMASLIMLLLAAPVAHGIRRRGSAGTGMILAIGIGMLFLLVDGMLGALGEAGVMPPGLAAWAPTLLFAAIGGAILVHVER